MTLINLDNSPEVLDWLKSLKSKQTKDQYTARWEIWLEYCKTHNLPSNGTDILNDMKKRRLSSDQTQKFFWDNELPKYFNWLKSEYKGRRGKNKGLPVSEGSALAMSTAIRGFFAFHRYGLDIKKDALPSSEKVQGIFEDHAFDIYQLRAMFAQGNLEERTILACGKDLWLRASDFVALQRDDIQFYIDSEKELATQENREPDILEFEVLTQKEKEIASCHLSRETVVLLEEYLRTYPKKNGALFPIGEEALTDLLRRLAEKAQVKLKPNTRIRWHCLRKFGITVMHGKVSEPVFKLMTGKHISSDLKTYIQANHETKTAFKMLEPLLSLTKQNGTNGNAALMKELEEMKKQTFKQMALAKILEKMLTKAERKRIMEELTTEIFGIGRGVPYTKDRKETTLEQDIEFIAEALEEKDLARILKENGKGENHNHE